MKLEFLGFCTTLITSENGTTFLIDPFFTGNPAAKITPKDLPAIDAMLITHGAFDHFGDSVEIAKKHKCQIFTEPATAKKLQLEGISATQITAVIWGTTREYRGVSIRGLYAQHWSNVDMKTYLLTGMPLGFVIHTENNKNSVYFAGDTQVYGDMKLYGELYPCKIGMFGVDSVPGHAFGMDGADAAVAAKLYNVETVIPMHYAPGSNQVARLESELKKIAPNITFVPMAAGDVLTF